MQVPGVLGVLFLALSLLSAPPADLVPFTALQETRKLQWQSTLGACIALNFTA